MDQMPPPRKRRRETAPQKRKTALDAESLTGKLDHVYLRQIFQWLPIRDKLNIEKVCKRWREASLQGWPEITSVDLRQYNARYYCQILQRCGPHLLQLAVKLTRNEIILTRMMKRYCPFLEEISVEWDVWTDLPLLYMAQVFRLIDDFFATSYRLKTVTVITCTPKFPNDFILHIRPETTKLSIHNSQMGITRAILKINLSQFKHLEVLDIRGYSIDMIAGLNHLTRIREIILEGCPLGRNAADLITDISYLPLLRRLCLCYSDMMDVELEVILTNCRSLIILDMFAMQQLTNATIENILTFRPALEELQFDNQFFFSTDPMPHFFHLKRLSFWNWTCYPQLPNRIVELIQQAPQLEYLSACHNAIFPHLVVIQQVINDRYPKRPLTIIMRRENSNTTQFWFETPIEHLTIVYT